MKPDLPDPPEELERRVELAMPLTQDFALLVLKGHLLVEEQIERLLVGLSENTDKLAEARLSFHQKLHLVQALVDVVPEDENLWDQLKTLNSIRNHLAHNLDTSTLDERVRLFAEMTKEDWDKLDQNGRAIELRDAIIGHCIQLIWFFDEMLKGTKLRNLLKRIEERVVAAEKQAEQDRGANALPRAAHD